MKKNYQTPSMRIVRLSADRIMVPASGAIQNVNSGTVGLGYGGGSSIEGRSRSFDDSDWE